LISKAVKKNNFVLSKLCKVAGVSRSGYYKWKERKPALISADETLVIQLFNEKKGKYGIRRLQMLIYRRYKRTINIKKIKRIKRDFNLITIIRKKNKFRLIFKTGEEHKVAPNVLKRNFISITKRTHFSTDITELPYSGGQKAYLSAMKDLATNEIVHFNILQRPTGDLVITNLEKVLKKYSSLIRGHMIIHSDQGVHYTSEAFRSKLKELGITQSMSRKGNCLDNSPIESFFGHLKDEVDFKSCKTFTEVKKKIEIYMKYYNNERPQWDLKQKTPAEAGVALNLVF